MFHKIALLALAVLATDACVYATSAPTRITLVRGDITAEKFKDPASSAIVNAANKHLKKGWGVCGAIYDAAKWPSNPFWRYTTSECGPGEAKLTDAGALSEQVGFVIHAVGPDCRVRDEHANKEIFLNDAYQNSLQLALNNQIATVAFPCISTAIFKFPAEEAANIAITAVINFIQGKPGLTEVRFVVFDDTNEALYNTILADHATRGILNATTEGDAAHHVYYEIAPGAPPVGLDHMPPPAPSGERGSGCTIS